MTEVKMRYVADKKPRLPIPPDLLDKRPDAVEVSVRDGIITGKILTYKKETKNGLLEKQKHRERRNLARNKYVGRRD